MKTLLLNSAKILGIICLTLFVTMLVWANWNEPPLSQKLGVKPINLAVFNIDKTANPADSATLSKNLTNAKGVTACTVNTEFKTVSVTYHEDEITESALKKIVESGSNYVASKVNFAAMEGPRCPVPAEYLNFLTDMKRTLCFR